MTDAKSLDERILAARSSQEISDLQAERSGRDQRVEGSRALASPVMKPGRVLVRCTRDGDVDLPADQLARALEIDPNLKVIAMGTTNSELEQRVAQCNDSAELALLMTEARKGKL
jgi:hypothetical protein